MSSVRKATAMLSTIVGVLLFAGSLFSQGNNGRILGRVTDQSGGVVSGATVTVVDKDRGVARTLTTDDAGEYNAPNLIPGTYVVRVEANGFKKLERQNVALEVGKEVRVDVTVQPGEATQSITVSENIPLVETTNATLGGTLENAQIEDLPLNGRNYQSLLGLRPGVMLQPGGGAWTQSTNNVRPDEIVWMVDGVINSNAYDTRPIAGMQTPITDGATILPIDAIQEFNLEENPKAEYGWRPGAIVNVGIKSGTNTLHGSAYAFGRSDAFNARNYFNPASVNGTCTRNPAVPSVCNKLSQQLEQFGATVGGPIKKDKLFYFAGYEGWRSSIETAYPTSVPETASQTTADPASSMADAIRGLQNYITANPGATLPTGQPLSVSPVSLALLGCSTSGSVTCTGGLIQNAPANTTSYFSNFPNSNRSDNGIAKLAYRINDKNQLTGTLYVADYYGLGQDGPRVNELFFASLPVRAWTNVENWIWTPNSRWVNEVRFGYDRVNYGLNLNPLDASRRADGSGLTGGSGYPVNTGVTATGGLPYICIGNFDCIGNPKPRPFQDGPNPVFDTQDNVSYLRGKHSFKFGFEYTHLEGDWSLQDKGLIDFGLNSGYSAFPGSTALEDFFAGAPNAAFILTGSAPVRRELQSVTAGYFQDDWRATPKLIINLGLRYSYQTPFTDANGMVGNFVPGVGLTQQGVGGVNSIFNPDHRDFAPRLGFAWDVTGKGTTVVRGGAGIVYSTFTVGNFFGQPNFQNDVPTTSMATTPTGACNTPVPPGQTCAQAGGSTLLAGGTIPNATRLVRPNRLNWNGTLIPSGFVPFCAFFAPCNNLAVDPNLKVPYVTNWNLEIQHSFNPNLSLSVGYVGNHGSRQTSYRNINQPSPGAGYCLNNPLTPNQLADAPAGGPGDCAGAATFTAGHVDGTAEQEARPYYASFPYLDVINQMSNFGYSWYHSLQTTLTQRSSHGLSFILGYTYAHGSDNGSLNRWGMLPQNSQDVRSEYASSDFDVRHRFTLTTSYNIPGKKGFGQLLEGWQVNAAVTLQSSQPWAVNDYTHDFSGTGDTSDRWDFFGNPADFKESAFSIPFCGIPANAPAGTPFTVGTVVCTQQNHLYGQPIQLSSSLASPCISNAPDLNTLAVGGCYVSGSSVMVPPKLGTFGTMGRNIFRDNGYKNVDFSIFKNFTFRERLTAQFRVEVFNLFNWPLIGNPYGASNGASGAGTGMDISSPSLFGCGCGTPDFVTGNPLVGSGDARTMQLGLKLIF